MSATPSKPDARTAPVRIALIGASVFAVGLGAALLLRPGTPDPMPAPGLDAPVDAAGLSGKGYPVTVAVLATIYEAFAETEEAAIYDGLARVAADEALEALYLERAGALASGGLPDQVVHELQLTDGTWRMEDGAMRADIRWAVLGEVGHAEHTHMRGNAYAATLVLAPAEGAWRLTEFELTDVDRTEAGTLTTPPEAGTVATGVAASPPPATDG